MTNCIEVRGLCKAFDGFALKDVSFTLPGGCIMGLIGENGAGKTTTLKCLLGLLRRDGGDISLLGCDPWSQPRQAKEEVGVVLDDCFFHDSLRLRDISAILSHVFPSWDNGLFRDYLDKFQLPWKKTVKELSRGMRMKLSLSAALAHRPRLLILDEATAGLDPVVRDDILEELLAFVSDEEHAVLLSSHITGDLEKIADYITYLHRGQVILSAPKDDILEQYGQVGCSAAQLSALEPELLTRVRRGEFGCHALVADRAAFQRVHPELSVEPVTLDDIMLFVGKGEAV